MKKLCRTNDSSLYKLVQIDPFIKTVSRIDFRDNSGKYHRLDKPAVIVYHEGNRIPVIFAEFYYNHGKLDRIDGPAVIYYDHRGKIISTRHFIDGLLVDMWDA